MARPMGGNVQSLPKGTRAKLISPVTLEVKWILCQLRQLPPSKQAALPCGNAEMKCKNEWFGKKNSEVSVEMVGYCVWGSKIPLLMLKLQGYEFRSNLQEFTNFKRKHMGKSTFPPFQPMSKNSGKTYDASKCPKFLLKDIPTSNPSISDGATGVESSTTCALDGGRCVGLGESVLLKRRSLIAVNLEKNLAAEKKKTPSKKS